MAEIMTVNKLEYAIKNYDWGKKGNNSYVAQLKAEDDHMFTISENIPYAELWMGSHPNGESLIHTQNSIIPLTKALGSTNLPYLFKILSVGESLSIQVHPNKHVAFDLHEKSPKIYTDSNHKPEMAIALSSFRAMLGIREIQEIKYFIEDLPPLKKLLGVDWPREHITASYEEKLVKEFVSKLFGCTLDSLKEAIDNILRLKKDRSGDVGNMIDLIEILHRKHPYDVGCLFVFIMNIVELSPGQAIFIDSNQPHAYLLGDCIECMANSDNVIRVGLTNKYKDISTLLSIANFSTQTLNRFLVCPRSIYIEEKGTRISLTEYCPPVEEFKVTLIRVSEFKQKIRIMGVSPLSIMIVVASTCSMSFQSDIERSFKAKTGNSFFFPNTGTLWLEDFSETEFVAYLAQPNTP